MNGEQISELIQALSDKEEAQLFETHISWVILAGPFAYKIKKPVKFNFLDFSSSQLRQQALEKELRLNQRLAPKLYLEVIPVTRSGENAVLGQPDGAGEVLDHALKMRRVDPDRQMDHRMRSGEVTTTDVKEIARIMADFHSRTEKIPPPFNLEDQRSKFADIATLEVAADLRAMTESLANSGEHFIQAYKDDLLQRGEEGFIRDGHGDLTSKNIFLLENPVIFDCIEFDDSLRQIDILNDIAFFCMDMDHFDRNDLSSAFLQAYCTAADLQLEGVTHAIFRYYCSYRANVRAKINLLRSAQCSGKEKEELIRSARHYLEMAHAYLEGL